MIGAAKRYQELLTELLIERELAGGNLAEDIESRHVEELDRCWWAMTTAEQQDVERLIADAPIEAPTDLHAEDVSLAEGEHELPRKRAA